MSMIITCYLKRLQRVDGAGAVEAREGYENFRIAVEVTQPQPRRRSKLPSSSQMMSPSTLPFIKPITDAK